jgi:hypothetical protein
MFGFVKACNAGGGEYYIPNPVNGCFEINADSDDAEKTADLINNRGKYRLILKNDQLAIFNMCNTGKALCVHIPSVCGDMVANVWFWRLK